MELSDDQVKRLKWWRKSTFLVMLFGYVGYYLVRQNLSAAFPLMEQAFGYTNSELGLIAASSEMAYAIGKFINGPLGDKIGGRRIFLIGMAGAIVSNLVFAFGSSLIFFVVVWCICRYFLSMGWGGIAKTIGAWYEPEKNGTVMGWISLNFQFGGAMALWLAAFLISIGVSWDKLFIYPALITTVIFIWSYFASREKPSDVIPGADFGKSQLGKTSIANFENKEDLSVKEIIFTLLKMPVFRQLLAFSFITTILRSIFVIWITKFLVDIGMGNASATFKSSLFPFLGVLGTILLGWYTDKYAKNGDRAQAMWIMLTGLVFCLGSIAFLADKGPEYHSFIVAMTGFSGFFLLGPYSMSSGCLTLDIAGAKGAGSSTGMIDGLGYVGSAFAIWGTGILSESLGWSQVFWILTGVSVLAVLMAYLISRSFQKLAPGEAPAGSAV